VAFLTGAGCSLTAGIPLAAQLVREIKDKYPDEIKRLVKPEQQDDYGCCMGALALGERKELLEPYLRSAKINWAHIALASLIHAEHVRRVLSFNFDSGVSSRLRAARPLPGHLRFWRLAVRPDGLSR